jgi:hypothetical protein
MEATVNENREKSELLDEQSLFLNRYRLSERFITAPGRMRRPVRVKQFRGRSGFFNNLTNRQSRVVKHRKPNVCDV